MKAIPTLFKSQSVEDIIFPPFLTILFKLVSYNGSVIVWNSVSLNHQVAFSYGFCPKAQHSFLAKKAEQHIVGALQAESMSRPKSH